MKWRKWMVAPAIIGGIAAGIGAIGAGLIGKSSARDQMSFQREMSGTSYQRAMEDMRLAGLNPILAYQQGGASTPSGAGWDMENPAAAGINTALSIAQNKATVDNTQASTAKTKADTKIAG